MPPGMRQGHHLRFDQSVRFTVFRGRRVLPRLGISSVSSMLSSSRSPWLLTSDMSLSIGTWRSWTIVDMASWFQQRLPCFSVLYSP